ncbi:MAG: hypothetical protein JWP36_1996 [Paucimonas sp.]|nr:hypothetical protein [Paucimonas sp.]
MPSPCNPLDRDNQPAASALALERVKYLRDEHAIHMCFANGIAFDLPVHFIEELQDAVADDLENIYLTPTGQTLALDAADAYISVDGLVRACLSQLPRAVLAGGLGALGGSASSDAKRRAAAENGKRGGRPRKPVA